MSKPDYEKLFFSLCGSIAVGDGNDCADDVFEALKRLRGCVGKTLTSECWRSSV